MKWRTLPPEEWPRLDGTELETCWRVFSPEGTRVVVVEDEAGAIVGTWAVLTMCHAEGVWIAPEHRYNGAVARQLLRGLRETVQELGADAVITAAVDPLVSLYIARLGGEALPGTAYLLPLKER